MFRRHRVITNLEKTEGEVIEQIIRPTGLLDPNIEVRPVKGQIDDLLEECRLRAERNERVFVTTLTKRMAENLSEYFSEVGVKVNYLHSDIHTLERIKVLRDLRRGEFDVLVGINLLREGSRFAGSVAWWRFWMPTKRAFCVPKRALSRQSDVRRGMPMDSRFFTRTRSRVR